MIIRGLGSRDRDRAISRGGPGLVCLRPLGSSFFTWSVDRHRTRYP